MEAGEIERNLEKVPELSIRWDTVLLIDECDVLIFKRWFSDLPRNQLVSIFLRLIEYYLPGRHVPDCQSHRPVRSRF